ncbi:unnamed protein product [Cuscuta campestris]|uniref:Uncharacterized protein n=1 Tax=Cuscuta campestris TaxID=132261 RepID=A0A484M5E6_9ASTE|nr:unnamed protein product [Cuscuta campestris]
MNMVRKMVQPEELANTGAVPVFWPYLLRYLTKSQAVCWAGFVSSGATNLVQKVFQDNGWKITELTKKLMLRLELMIWKLWMVSCLLFLLP